MNKLIVSTILGMLISSLSFTVFSAVDNAPENETVSGIANGKFFVLKEDMEWVIGRTTEKIVVPKGFVTDYASIPKLLWDKGLEPRGWYDRASIIHDYLYWSQGCTRAQADRLMVIAMKESNVGTIDGFLIYTALDKFGKLAWDSNAKAKSEGKPKVLPNKYLTPQDPNMTWEDYRKEMIKLGVKDPAFPKNPSYCKYGNTTEVPSKNIENVK